MAKVTLFVRYDAPDGVVVPELKIDTPASKSVEALAKAVSKLVSKKHGVAPVGPVRLFLDPSGSAVDASKTVGEAVGPGPERLSARVDYRAPEAARPAPAPARAAPPPKAAATSRPRLDGACVVVATQGLLVRGGRSLDSDEVAEAPSGSVVRVDDDDGARCRVAFDDVAGYGSSKCLAPLVDAGDPLSQVFADALSDDRRPPQETDVWVRRKDGVVGRADAIIAQSRDLGPGAWAFRLPASGDRVPLSDCAPVYVESGPGRSSDDASSLWDLALSLTADVAAGAAVADGCPDPAAIKAWAARAEAAAARGRHAAAALALTAAIANAKSHQQQAPLHRKRAAAFWRGRASAAPPPPKGSDERGASPAFPLVLSLLAARDWQFYAKLKPPKTAPAPPATSDATDAELDAIKLFARMARLPNLLLWPMDAADPTPGR